MACERTWVEVCDAVGCEAIGAFEVVLEQQQHGERQRSSALPLNIPLLHNRHQVLSALGRQALHHVLQVVKPAHASSECSPTNGT